MTPEVSLVVSTLGRTVELRRLLRSLDRQTFKNFEVIIVDQNDDMRLAPILAGHSTTLKLVSARSARGLSLGRNTGLALARGRIIAFPDDDCWYPPELLTRIVAMFARAPDIDLLSGRTVDRTHVPSLGVFHPSSRAIGRGNVWQAGNSNTIFVRHRTEHALTFDETLGVGARSIFQSGEETDFMLRLLASGARLQFEPDVEIHHDQIDLRDERAGLQRARAYAPGQGRVLRLHRFHPLHVFWLAARPLGRAILAFGRGDMALARYKLAWSCGLLTGYLARI